MNRIASFYYQEYDNSCNLNEFDCILLQSKSKHSSDFMNKNLYDYVKNEKTNTSVYWNKNIFHHIFTHTISNEFDCITLKENGGILIISLISVNTQDPMDSMRKISYWTKNNSAALGDIVIIGGNFNQCLKSNEKFMRMMKLLYKYELLTDTEIFSQDDMEIKEEEKHDWILYKNLKYGYMKDLRIDKNIESFKNMKNVNQRMIHVVF